MVKMYTFGTAKGVLYIGGVLISGVLVKVVQCMLLINQIVGRSLPDSVPAGCSSDSVIANTAS